MDRKQLFEALLKSGKYHQHTKHFPLWVEAFEAYKKDTGDNQVSMDCGSCFKKVKQWLEK